MYQSGKMLSSNWFFSNRTSPYHGLFHHEFMLEVNLPRRFKSWYQSLMSHGCSFWKDDCPDEVGNFENKSVFIRKEDKDKVTNFINDSKYCRPFLVNMISINMHYFLKFTFSVCYRGWGLKKKCAICASNKRFPPLDFASYTQNLCFDFIQSIHM